MKPKWNITFLTAILSMSLLAGCNADKRDSLNQENDVNFRPVQYNRKTNVNESNNDFKNQENRRFLQEHSPEQMDREKDR